jgi:ATP-dependent DNA ligase
MVKVKTLRTVDCVVGGMRLFPGPVVASLVLGLWDGPALVHVGVASAFPEAERRALLDLLAPRAVPLEGHPWERGFNVAPSPVGRLHGSAGRWDPATMELDWIPLGPDVVCEVAYDQRDGLRLRHPARFVRWRPDRLGSSCSVDQLRPGPAGAEAPP